MHILIYNEVFIWWNVISPFKSSSNSNVSCRTKRWNTIYTQCINFLTIYVSQLMSCTRDYVLLSFVRNRDTIRQTKRIRSKYTSHTHTHTYICNKNFETLIKCNIFYSVIQQQKQGDIYSISPLASYNCILICFLLRRFNWSANLWLTITIPRRMELWNYNVEHLKLFLS